MYKKARDTPLLLKVPQKLENKIVFSYMIRDIPRSLEHEGIVVENDPLYVANIALQTNSLGIHRNYSTTSTYRFI